MITVPISILKPAWSRRTDGQWEICDLKSVKLKPRAGSLADYFIVEGDVELMTSTPSGNFHEMLASFGTVDFLMKQSIVPVVAWQHGDEMMRCIGTASIISCTGFVMTAAHVIMDPFDNGYGATRKDGRFDFDDELNFGVLMPINPAGYGTPGLRFFPFERYCLWGNWRESPLVTEKDKFEYLTDIAICKVLEMPHGASHQPLSLSVNPFVSGELAYSLGYAKMDDIRLEYDANGNLVISPFEMNLYASIGEIMTVFPYNSAERNATTPGPCFDFKATIPGKMSGAPIFGAKGAVVRGVVSRSFQDEKHAYGAMIGPVMDLPLNDSPVGGQTLREMMKSGNEGVARVEGAGL